VRAFGSRSDPVHRAYYVVALIAASPNVAVRGLFFTLYLLCVIVDREEYIVMRFILGLKGTQFISGIIKVGANPNL
jgi:hypothetical protein